MVIKSQSNGRLQPAKMQLTPLQKRFKKRLIDLNQPQSVVADHFGWTNTYITNLVAGQSGGSAARANLKKVKDYVGIK